MVYGGLPPEMRRMQARLFNEPDSGYDVLVASDAIGMGLNLNIRRIVFHTLLKSSAGSGQVGFVEVPPSQVKQIAGAPCLAPDDKSPKMWCYKGGCMVIACFLTMPLCVFDASIAGVSITLRLLTWLQNILGCSMSARSVNIPLLACWEAQQI